MSTATPLPTKEIAERDFVISRTFAAPRDLVFRAWTEPERMKHWWGPKGFTSPVCHLDLRAGGSMHYCMRSPDGRDSPGCSFAAASPARIAGGQCERENAATAWAPDNCETEIKTEPCWSQTLERLQVMLEKNR